ncbi:plastocyanin [Arthrobacter sp. CAN_A214]|uniref:cupredoxin domain-containing protein n=1 Tax=Arthrobacter sp. CAN_A214 TaxID=2787720 RepID=UPI0018CA0AB1
MKLRYGLSALILAALLMGATACGSGAGPGATEATTPPTEVAAPESAAATAGAGTSAPASSAAISSAEAAPAEEVLITIADFEYVMPESIAPGAMVTVINEDDAPHTVTAEDDGGFDVDVQGGETVTFTAPDEPGEYAVICVYHPGMSSTLVIR